MGHRFASMVVDPTPSAADLRLRDIFERVIDKGIVVDPTSQLVLLEKDAASPRVWVVEDAPPPLVLAFLKEAKED